MGVDEEGEMVVIVRRSVSTSWFMVTRQSIALITLLAAVSLAGCNGSGGEATTTTTEADGVTTTAPETIPPIEDGEWFALVTVGEDETGAMTLGVDLAEMLTGEEAKDAATEDGFISEGEDLPNDFYIRNPDTVMELIHFGDDPEILVIPSTDTSQMVSISPEDLEQLYEGTHPDADTHYVAPHTPIPMDVTVSGGQISAMSQVYLP
jgi:hypothetical protein